MKNLLLILFSIFFIVSCQNKPVVSENSEDDLLKPAPIENFVAKGIYKAIELSWDKPDDPNYRSIVIFRKSGKTCGPPVYGEGVNLSVNKNATSYLDKIDRYNIMYCYSIFAVNSSYHSTSVYSSAIPFSVEPVSSLNLIKDDDSIKISWVFPNDKDFLGVKIFKKGSNEDIEVCDKKKNETAECIDLNIKAGDSYIYKAYSYSDSGTISMQPKSIEYKSWLKQFGIQNFNAITSITTDSENNSYIAESVSDGAAFTSYISKYDNTGQKIWTKEVSVDEIINIKAYNGDIYVFANKMVGSKSHIIFKKLSSGDGSTATEEKEIRLSTIKKQGTLVSYTINCENPLAGTTCTDFDQSNIVDIDFYNNNIYYVLKGVITLSNNTKQTFLVKNDLNGNPLQIDNNGYYSGGFAKCLSVIEIKVSRTITSMTSISLTHTGIIYIGGTAWNINNNGGFPVPIDVINVNGKYDSETLGKTFLQSNTYINTFKIETDSIENFYTLGQTKNTQNNGKVLLVKYSQNGSFLWKKELDIGSKSVYASNLLVDSNNNIYITGYTYGALPDEIHKGDTDLFIAKYNSNGTRQWIWQDGTNKADTVKAASIDSSNKIYLGGYTTGTFEGLQHNWFQDSLFILF